MWDFFKLFTLKLVSWCWEEFGLVIIHEFLDYFLKYFLRNLDLFHNIYYFN